MKTVINLDDDALAAAAAELGTSTSQETVNAALAYIAERHRLIDELLDGPLALGLGPDISNSQVMWRARR
jgi:Arc/MetJ family transcription regulator